MANADAAFGFVPVRHMSGNSPRANKYTITSELAENIFMGDLCIVTSGGVVTPHTATETNNIGVFAGVSYTASDGSYIYSQYWPTGTTATNIVISGTMAAGIATCKILALHDSPENAFGANAVMEVTINEHLLGTNVAGI